MSCPLVPYKVFSRQMMITAAARRIPLTGTFELTDRCQLACPFCYVRRRPGDAGGETDALDTAAVAAILDQLADAGCLWLALTGGDPLARRDFPDVYREARRRGFLITLMTNAVGVTPGIADLLADLPPFSIEVTLYGATPETYDRTTGTRGTFDRALAGIARLAERRLPLTLKTTVSTLNLHEFEAIAAHATRLGVPFRWDALLNARLDDGTLDTRLRIPAAEAVRLEAGSERVAESWRKAGREGPTPTDPGRLFECAAGVTAFSVDPRGHLMPCLMVRAPAFDLRSGRFADGWDGPIRRAVEARRTGPNRCWECADARFCSICPGWGAVEHGDPEAPVEALCQVARARRQAFGHPPGDPSRGGTG